MSYWSHNPELYDDLCIRNLPRVWRECVEQGYVELESVPWDVRAKAYDRGEADWWSGQIDAAKERRKYGE